jgi:GNAT superfamily N-acetyltransferase
MSSYADDAEFEFSLRPASDPEFSHYLLHFSGKAICWDDATAEDKAVGQISGHRLDLAAARSANLGFQYFLDSVSAEVSDLANNVFEGKDTCVLKKSIKDGIEKAECDSIIYIDTLLVNSAYRGKGIGKTLLRRLSEMIDMENGLVALKAYPIPDDPLAISDSDSAKSEQEVENVKLFYSHLGFQRAADNFMIKDARTCISKKHKIQEK